MKPIIRSFLHCAVLLSLYTGLAAQDQLVLNEQGYFGMPGLNIMVFSDTYPEGHQSGVTIIQHGVRVAANGDLRLEVSPGQWAPVPKPGKRQVDRDGQKITQELWYPDTSRNGKGYNPIFYPDLSLRYRVEVSALENSSFRIRVDLEEPLPAAWEGRVGFNLELFPGDLFGATYLMDGNPGMFPPQPSGPVSDHQGTWLADPMARGRKLVLAPERKKLRMIIESHTGGLELWDGRTNHNNGWFIVRTPVRSGATDGAVEWIVTPNVVKGWVYGPVLQVSQLGYHPSEPKKLVIEQDQRDSTAGEVTLYRLTERGREAISTGRPEYWGDFLRYRYYIFDFSALEDEGVYQAGYRSVVSHPFRISRDVYKRQAWQPVMDYFLPVQMCHMRINEKYRVWHGACHLDDALMAPTDSILFDGYSQGPSTLTDFSPFDHVPGLDRGGWHDAGDYDLRVESQAGTVWRLALMIEEFGLDYDATMIDEEHRVVEIHSPDGTSDAIQQIEHGLYTILGGYRALGRLYRGIICSDKRQYVLLGDASVMTDNVDWQGKGKMDDRWVFTEDNPDRALQVAAALAAASRVLKNENPGLSQEALETARELWELEGPRARRTGSRVVALSELILATDDAKMKTEFTEMKDEIIRGMGSYGWAVAHVIDRIDDEKFRREVSEAAKSTIAKTVKTALEDSPYGVPYRPRIWGAGWNIQELGFEQYFFNKAWPGNGSEEIMRNALQFVLGVHPGSNNASFASGIGSKSALVAYGVNRADWSYIPGGVTSGTALIRPDFPEYKVWPFFWQQTEYVMGGGSTNYMFLVLAAQKLAE